MPFPEARRVLYRENPLEQVICQLRFPPILKIDAEIPATFQDRIRAQFPKFTENQNIQLQLPPNLPFEVPPQLVENALGGTGIKNYQFTSEDDIWRVNLTRSFVALSTSKYERWEQFKEKLRIPFDALNEVYSPSYFSRVGLRYVDVFKRSQLGLDGVPWRELLNPFISGLLGSPELAEKVKSLENQSEIDLADGTSIVKIIARLVQAEDNGEICFMLDNDFFNITKTEIDFVTERLNFLNMRASRLIQWAISQRLHQAMGPEFI